VMANLYRVRVGQTIMLDRVSHAAAVNHRAMLRRGGFRATLEPIDGARRKRRHSQKGG
jgi:hypothetical protein